MHPCATSPCPPRHTCPQCHARGVILRDIKPENFLFVDDSPDARLVLIDFGIAAFLGPDQTLTDRAGATCTPLCFEGALRGRAKQPR